MEAVLLDSLLTEKLIRRRRETGADRYDEVWNGVYVMSPIANNEHQWLATRLSGIISNVIDSQNRGRVFAGANVSDQETDWTQNYRVPDVAVFLAGNPAEDRRTHWYGGPDFAIEIVSPNDRSRDKFNFYAAVNTREVLILDRYPWALELYRLEEGRFELVGRSVADDETVLVCLSIPFSFRFHPGDERPQIEVTTTETQELVSI
jgi:Uma2 family endonuclease